MARYVAVAGVVLLVVVALWSIWDVWIQGTIRPTLESPARPRSVDRPRRVFGTFIKTKVTLVAIGVILLAVGLATR